MKNDYGVKLDHNGYAPSIIPDHCASCCWNCGKNGASDPLNRHEIFYGPYREKSKRLGLWVYLCHSECHLNGVHKDTELDLRLKQVGQYAAMKHYHWDKDEFRREFGRNYL